MTNALRVSAACRTNGIRIHYRRGGVGTAPLVALHGLLASGDCWTPVVRHLEQEFDVVTPDSRGHGGSGAPEHGYSYPQLAADVEGLIGILGLSSPILLGHSMGGLTATLVAARMADRIGALVLLDPTFISPAWQVEAHESTIRTEHENLLKLGRDALVARAVRRQPQRSREILELLADARLQTSPRAFEVLVPPYPDYATLIRSVAAPILLVIGSEGVVSAATARTLAQINPRLEWHIIEGAGHGMPYDRPEEIAEIAKTFLRRVLPTNRVMECAA